MSALLSTVCRSTAIKNLILVRQAQSIARLTVCHQSCVIDSKKYHNQFETAQSNSKLLRSFSTSGPNEVSAAHDHSRLWTIERLVSAALIAVVLLAFITPHTYLDYALALSMVTHVHWGMEAIVVDYVRPRLFGPILPKIGIALTYLLSILTLAGLYYFNYSDVGLSQAIMMFLKK